MTGLQKISSNALALVFMGGIAAAAHAQAAGPYDWSGPYVGGSLSWTRSDAATSASTSDSFPGSYFTPPDPEQIAGAAHGSIEQSRSGLGVFAGIGRQSGQVYLGVEGGLSSLRLNGSRSSGAVYISNPAGGFNNELSVKANWQAMLRARLGWAQDRWMAYLTGGIAATRLKMSASFSDNFLGVGARGQVTRKDTRLGWTLGLGGEYALSNGWVIRGEYAYVRYGKFNASASVFNPAFPVFGNDLVHSVDLDAQMVSIGVSYRF